MSEQPTADVLAAVSVIGRRNYNPKDRAINLPHCNLQGADLTMAFLPGAAFEGSDPRQAKLSAATLQGAKFQFAHLAGANLSGSFLLMANLSGADCSNTSLTQSSMIGAVLNCDLSGADLNGADMRGVQFLENSNLVAAELHGVYLQDSQRSTMEVSGASGVDQIDWYPAHSCARRPPQCREPVARRK